MKFFKKIKDWLNGKSNKNSSYKTSKKSLSSSNSTTYTTKNTNNKSELQKQLAKQKAEQKKQKEQLLQAFKAKESKVTTKAQDSGQKKANNGTSKAIAKLQQKAAQNNAYNTSKKSMASNKSTRMPEVKTRENELMKQKKAATGLGTKEVQFQQKLGLNPTLTATDITYGNAKAPIATAAITGVTNGALLGVPELLQRKAQAPIQNALNDVQQSYTKGQKWAEGIGEFAGMIAPYAMTSGAGAKIGSNVLSKVGTSTEGVAKAIEGSKFMQSIGAKTGKDIASISSKIAKELTKDLGLHLTTENVQSIIMSLNNNADNPDANAGDYVGEYIKQQAINTALNIGMDLTPLLGKAARQIGEASAIKLADQAGAVTNDAIVKNNKNVSKAINLSTQGSAYTNKELSALKNEASSVLEDAKRMIADGDDISAARAIREKAEQIASGVKEEVGDSSVFADLRKELRNTKLNVENVKSDVNYSEGFRKQYSSKIKFGKDGVEIDKKYQELAEAYPELFPKEIENTADQLLQIAKVIDDIQPKYTELPEEEIQATADYIAEAMWKETGSKDTLDEALEKYPRGEFVSDEIEQSMLSAKEQAEVDKIIAKDNKKLNNATSEAKVEPPKTEELAKVDDAMAGVKEADNIKADAEAELDKAVKKNVNQAPLSKSGKQVDKARMKAEKAKIGKAKKMGGKNTSFGEALKTEEIYKEKLTPDTRMGHGAVNATNNARQDLYRKTGQELAEAGGFEFDVWHDKDNYEKSFNRIANTVFTKKGKVDSKGVKLITDEFNNFANGTRNIAVGDESKRATFDAISMMNFCNAHYADDSAGKVLTKAEKELNKALNEAYAASVAQYTKLANASATTMRLGKQMAEANPAARAMAVKKCVMNMLNDSLGFVRKNGKLTDADYVKFINDNKEIKEAFLKLEELSKTANKEALDSAIGDVYKAVNKKVPLTLLDAVTEWRYICMLCSPKTHVRNFVGNSLFGAVRQVSDAMAASKELRLYNKGKIKYLTKGGIDPKITKEAHMTAKALEEKGSESAKIAKEAYDKAKGNMFKENQKYEMYRASGGGKAIEGMRKWGDFISSWLEKEDSWAIEWRYRENYQKFLKANKYGTEQQTIKDTKKLLALANEYSQNEALEATFREYNEIAANMNKFMANMTKADAGIAKRGMAVAMNTMMPFVKTPMNVLKQSVVNYNPMFLFKAHNELKTAISKGDTEAINKAVEKIAKKETGGLIVALGAMIGAIDGDLLNVRTNAGDDAGEKYKKRQGFQDYSISVGNKFSATLDWATPTASVFFTGVEFGKQIKEILSGEGIDFSSAMSIIGMTASRVLDPTLETSMLSGINSALDTLKKSQYDENASKMSAAALIAENMAGNYVSSLVPTILSQVSRTLAPNDYMVTGKNNVDYFGNLMLSKIPFVSNAVMPAKTDSWGRVSGDKGSGAERIGKTALALVGNVASPANVKKINWDKTDDKLVKLYEKTGDEDVLPTISYDRSFEVGQNGKNGVKKTEVTLTPKQMSIYNQARATGGEDAMASVLENIMFNRPTTDSNGNKVLSKDAYDKSAKQKLISQYKGKSTKEVVEWLMNQPQYRKASEAEKKQVLSTLFDNSGEKAKGNRKTSERAVWKAQGKDVNEYDFKNELSAKKQSNLKDAISSGVVTYKEAVDFARNAGKTYYYEDEDGGGSSQTYYNKKEMIAYLQSKGYSYEKAETLYNAFKNSSAKSYNGSGSSGSGRSYGHRRSSGGSSSGTSSIKMPTYNISTYKPKTTKSTVAKKFDTAFDTAFDNLEKASAKVKPPKNKEFKL